MKPTQPPAVAAWLLERLASGERQESLIGDLLEQYRQGRSASWYRRQVLMAILVSVAKALRDHKRFMVRIAVLGSALCVLASFPVRWLTGLVDIWVLAYAGCGVAVALLALGCSRSGPVRIGL
jgi:hypothetical protein